MATTWDNGSTEYTLPNPDREIDGPNLSYHGSAVRKLDGVLGVDTIPNLTATIPLTWTMATTAERAAIRAAFDACAHVSSILTLEDGDSFTVLAIQNGLTDRKWFAYNDAPRYYMAIVFDEIGS